MITRLLAVQHSTLALNESGRFILLNDGDPFGAWMSDPETLLALYGSPKLTACEIHALAMDARRAARRSSIRARRARR